MSIFQAIILGIVQGLTEFLPISSSGHLVIIPHLFGWEIPAEQVFVFDVLVQMGTLLSVIFFFWKDIYAITAATLTSLWNPAKFSQPEVRLGAYLALATIPAGLGGIFLNDIVESAFASPMATAFFLLGTAILLLVAERVGRRTVTLEKIHWQDALWIGLFQVLALFPGISRSGTTITGGMVRNLDRESAARFSFLMSVPIMVAAGMYTNLDLFKVPDLSSFILPMAVGIIVSAVVGFLSIRWLLKYLQSNSLYGFAIYLVGFSLLTLIIL